MLLIPFPSDYDRRRSAKLTSKRRIDSYIGIGVGVACAVALAIRFPAAEPAIVVGSAAIVVFFAAMHRGAVPTLQGVAGERCAVRLLRPLSDDYTAITSIRIPGYERIGDLGVVLVGPHGIAVIEAKSFRRRIVVAGDRWTAEGRAGPTPIPSVSRKLRHQVRALTKFLGSQGVRPDIYPVIALSPSTNIRVDCAPPYPIVTYGKLAGYIEELPKSRRAVDIDRLVGLLARPGDNTTPAP